MFIIHNEAVGCLGIYFAGQSIATSAEVTPNGGLVWESPKYTLNLGVGIIVICPGYGKCTYTIHGSYGPMGM